LIECFFNFGSGNDASDKRECAVLKFEDESLKRTLSRGKF
jgi:hypothetical protein